MNQRTKKKISAKCALAIAIGNLAFPRNISSKRLIWQLSLSTATALLLIYAICHIAISRFAHELTNIEIENLMTSVQSGPAQFAFLNSTEIAESELSRLLKSFQRERSYLLEGQILSGERFESKYAVWSSSSETKPECIVAKKRDVDFQNAIYPFRILLSYDACQANTRFAKLGLYLVAAAALGFVFLLFCYFAILAPVVKSFRLASQSINDTKTTTDMISFLPLRRLAHQASKAKHAEKDAAIARTTQALAHDVRKPFSMFKAVIQAVEATNDINETREILLQSIPEVNQAMASVEGMVQDIMQIGTEAQPVAEDVSSRQVVYNALKELFRVYPDANVSIESEFRETSLISIDTARFSRVLSNILGNALQAMSFKGTIWIKTSDSNERVEMRIGNSGSCIPKENLPKLFDAFFTSGKKGGTGLGLAIAKKIVEMHGGQIHCESDKSEQFPAGFVEFVFTVPMASGKKTAQGPSNILPAHSHEFYTEFAKEKKSQASGSSLDEAETILVNGIVSKTSAAQGIMCIMIVDDESIYRRNTLNLLAHVPEISSRFTFVETTNSEEALQGLEKHQPILVIQDIDLGVGSDNGFEVIKKMRTAGFKGQICMHSNRFLPADNREALEAGAQHTIPKPMSRIHLLKLIEASLENSPTHATSGSTNENSVTPEERPLHVALLDDSAAIRIAWKTKFKNGKLTAFSSPVEFFEKVRTETDFLKSVDVVVTDYHFDSRSKHDGFSFAEEFKTLSDLPLLLASDGDFNENEWKKHFHGILKKQVYAATQLREILRKS